MKKIITTLCVIFVAALGAQGQSTVEFPSTGSSTFTGLSFNTYTATLTPPSEFDTATLLIGVSGLPAGVTVDISNLSLTGQGISGALNFPDALQLFRNVTTPTGISRFEGTEPLSLTSPIQSWNSSSNNLSFNIQVNNGSLTNGGRIYYAVQYSFGVEQINTAFGNVNLVAVPEPSTYFAAAGLLGLCLWSARRQLLKLAGSRFTSSGSGSNGAA